MSTRWLLVAAIVIPLVGIPLLGWIPAGGRLREPFHNASTFARSELPFQASSIPPYQADRPRITNVQILDFDDDRAADVIVCDARRNAVLRYQQASDGAWQETTLGSGLVAPAHATCVDLDGDGQRDVLVAVLGNLYPDDSPVGSVVWLQQQGDGTFSSRTLLSDVRRVADVQPGDFDGDGDLDLAVAVFGYARGEVLWLENLGDESFIDHRLDYAAGAIHVPVADFDGDGDLDIATVISQETEEVWGYENDGQGHFSRSLLFHTVNYDVGSAGLVASDLDSDGDMDLLLPLGDNLEYRHTFPQPYHGCLWLENVGGWTFESHRIATFGGTYAAAIDDLDGDGDRDVVLVSMFNDWRAADPASVVWLENDGQQNFTPWQIAANPTQLSTVACGDINGDGRPDIVAGCMPVLHADPESMRLPVWINGSAKQVSRSRPIPMTAVQSGAP